MYLFFINNKAKILNLMGRDVFDYCLNFAQGNIDYIIRLPTEILVCIICYLSLEDIMRLEKTSMFFKKVCI